MSPKISAVILAGGRCQRFFPVEKCIALFKGKPLILHVVERLRSVASAIVVVARDEEQGAVLKCEIPHEITLTFDRIQNFGPLAGILAGLQASSNPFSIVVGCDMPFLSEEALKFLAEQRSNYDAVVPLWEDGKIEPLHAIYRKKAMLKATKEAIRKGEHKISFAISSLKVNFVPVAKIRKFDPPLRTFTNINTPEDLLLL